MLICLLACFALASNAAFNYDENHHLEILTDCLSLGLAVVEQEDMHKVKPTDNLDHPVLQKQVQQLKELLSYRHQLYACLLHSHCLHYELALTKVSFVNSILLGIFGFLRSVFG